MISLLAALIAPPLYASFNIVDISPPELLPLGGYTERKDRKMDPGGEPLFARSLFLRQGASEIAIVSMDALTVPLSFSQGIQKELGDIKLTLMLCSTHTHSAPDSQMLNAKMKAKLPGIASFSSKQNDWYTAKLVELLRKKNEGLEPVGVAVEQGEIDLNRGRRSEADAQKRFWKVQFRGPQKSVWLLNYPAHPTVFDETRNKTSGDWPSAWTERYQYAMFLNGAIGDVSPAPPEGAKGEDGVSKMASALFSAKSERVEVPSSNLIVWREKVKLPYVRTHPEFAKSNGIPQLLANSLVKQFAETDAEIVIVRYGDLAIIGIPGEPASELGRRIESAAKTFGVKYPIIASFANNWLGYILTKEGYDKGGYEATLSFHGPELADAILDATKNGFTRMSESIN